jgi:hypothetical protein
VWDLDLSQGDRRQASCRQPVLVLPFSQIGLTFFRLEKQAFAGFPVTTARPSLIPASASAWPPMHFLAVGVEGPPGATVLRPASSGHRISSPYPEYYQRL